MKKGYILAILTLCAAATLICNSCSNPLVDDNGDDIPLIRIDLPPFDATYLIDFVELNGLATTPNGADVEVQLLGPDAADLYDESFSTSNSYMVHPSGVLSLNLDPNIQLSQSNPLDFTIAGQNHNYVVLPWSVHQTVPGNKRLQVEVINVANGPQAMGGTRGITFPDLTDGSPSATKIVDLSGRTNGNGYEYGALYRAGTSGIFTCENPGSGYADYGMYVFGGDLSLALQKEAFIQSGSYFVTVKKPINLVTSELTIEVNGPQGYSTAFGYEILVGGRTYTGTIAGTLPLSSTIEQIYLSSTGSKAASVRLIPSAPYQLTQSSMGVNDITSANASASFDATVATNPQLRECSIELLAFCGTDKSIAYSLSRQFQFRKTSAAADEPWSNGELKAGKCKIYLDDNTRYTFRIALNDKWVSYDLTTNLDEIGAILGGIDGVKKYVMKNTSATSYSIYIEIANDELCTL